MHFKNQVIWVTGASSGIGKSLAIELSKQDVQLILSSRNREALELVKNECENSDNVEVLPLDLEDYNNLHHKVDEAITFFGRIDMLVNNGGISQRSLAKDTSIEVDKRLMDVNLFRNCCFNQSIITSFYKKTKTDILL